MLAPTGAAELTVDAFHDMVMQCAVCAASAAQGGHSDSLARLAAIAARVQERTLELGKVFRETHRNGQITLPNMVRDLCRPPHALRTSEHDVTPTAVMCS